MSLKEQNHGIEGKVEATYQTILAITADRDTNGKYLETGEDMYHTHNNIQK